jgi:hypothetical protein
MELGRKQHETTKGRLEQRSSQHYQILTKEMFQCVGSLVESTAILVHDFQDVTAS